MKKVKYFLCLFALMLTAAFLTSKNVSAASVEVNTLTDLISVMATGGEAVLNADITLDGNRAIANPLTLDLNGHKIYTDDFTLVVRSDFTLKDDAGDGAIIGGSDFSIQVGSSVYVGNFTLESGLITTDSGYGVQVYQGTLTINGGRIYAPEFTIYNYDTVIQNGGVVEAAAVGVSDATVRNNGGGTYTMNGGKIIAQGSGIGMSNAFDYGNNGDGTMVGSSAIINDGEISAIGAGGSAVVAFKNSSVTLNGGTLISDNATLMSNGSVSGKSEGTNAKFTITGGTITANNSIAIYAPQPNGEVNISGGTIRGAHGGIELRAGKLNITGGTIIGDTPVYEVVSNKSGSTTKGAAVAIAQHNTMLPILTHICGGTFRAAVPFSITNPEGNDEDAIAQVSAYIDQPCGELLFESIVDGDPIVNTVDAIRGFVTGGIFSGSVDSYLAPGYGERETEDGKFEVLRLYNLQTRTTRGGGVDVSKRQAFAGDTIDVDTDANLAYELKSLSRIGRSSGTETTITNEAFTMPAEDVTVAASFGFIPSPEPQAENLPDPTPGPDSIPVAQQNAKPSAVVTVKKKDGVKPIEPEEPKTSDNVETPNTFDGLAAYITIMTICGAGLLAVVPKPRKN